MPHVIVVQQHNALEHDHLLAEMYRQRKRIFGDKLGWDVWITNGQEIDKYDALDPVYLICMQQTESQSGPLAQFREAGTTDDPSRPGRCMTATASGVPVRTRGAPTLGHVTGSLRLLPTTGPTLLADTFADTLPDAMFSAPSIWECTRFCAEDHETAAALIAALGELCLQSGIESIVGNFDAAMLRVYARIGCEVEVLGKTKRDGRTVYLGIFPVTEAILRKVRSRIADMGMVAA